MMHPTIRIIPDKDTGSGAVNVIFADTHRITRTRDKARVRGRAGTEEVEADRTAPTARIAAGDSGEARLS